MLPAAIWEQQKERKKKSKFLYSTLGEVNDVIGRKYLECDALCLPEVLDLIRQKGRVSTHTAIAENLARSGEAAWGLFCSGKISALRSTARPQICHALNSDSDPSQLLLPASSVTKHVMSTLLSFNTFCTFSAL